MSSQIPLKYEWPYVQYLPRDEVKSYQSTLPEDFSNIRVRQIIPTPIWQRPQLGYEPEPTYLSHEVERNIEEGKAHSLIVLGSYSVLLYASMWSMAKWYNSNIVKNYIYFKSETWPSYLKLRALPVAACVWTVLYAFYYN
ncbi:unnamed protein product [Blepharisma stoltei]|uniref:Uncharacterized protein n=1 Tax=Blepharisma stoltei TaxID=1481888 RepID=A0AAU9JZC6_9CILI|nr:unnamed protein product [Blepharisma stoltei]